MQRHRGHVRSTFRILAGALAWTLGSGAAAEDPKPLERHAGAKPLNVVFVLTDDHRYDALGFMGHPFLETPHLDALADQGVHFRNAFVTTSLCSPSRASILTGLYAHRHRVVDNNQPIPPGTVFFPQHLQQAGYRTAFVGKWHMGDEGDDPQPGFHHWVSFKGQGTYQPRGGQLNVNGTRVPRQGYITDELTDHAVQWLESLSGEEPFFLYLSHKAVHADFVPAERHAGRYRDRDVEPPLTMVPPPRGAHWPAWTQDQRNSWHGVDFPYHSRLDVWEYYRRYLETLLGVDESVGRVVDLLQRRGWLDDTIVLYMGDNGFAFGEHGLIDKRTAYEESMRVPMLARVPGVPGGTVVEQVVANIDVAPTVLEAAGLVPPPGLDGRSMLPLLREGDVPWRAELLYEYFWERNFPQTPTVHALRGDRYKYMRYHGIWDVDELYDLQEDPLETRNLIASPEHRQIVVEMNRRLFEILEETGGMAIPLKPDTPWSMRLRRPDIAAPAAFPEPLIAPAEE